jgi:hypothetical protein
MCLTKPRSEGKLIRTDRHPPLIHPPALLLVRRSASHYNAAGVAQNNSNEE